MSGRPSSRRHLQATVCQAGQRRRALSCAAGAEPRAENRRLPIFEHGEHLPFDPPCAPWHPALHRSDRVVRRLLVVCRVSSRCQGTDRAIDRASPDRSHTVATLKAATRTPVWGRSPAISQHAICRSAPSVLARARGSTFRPTHRALSSNPHSDYSTPHCCTERFARQALSHSSSEHAMSFRIYTTSRAIGTQSVGQFC